MNVYSRNICTQQRQWNTSRTCCNSVEEGIPCDELQSYFSCNEIFTSGSWNAKVHPGVFHDGDVIFTTQSPNAFTPQLQEYLKANSISKLLLCGYTLDFNVYETMLKACMEVDDNTDILIVEDCCVVSSMKNHLRHLYAMQAVRIVDQKKARQLITSPHTSVETAVVVKSASMKQKHIRMSVEREIPLTLNLPGRPEQRTTLRRATIIGRTNFVIPKRRTQFNLEIEGFKISGNVNIQAHDTYVNEQSPL